MYKNKRQYMLQEGVLSVQHEWKHKGGARGRTIAPDYFDWCHFKTLYNSVQKLLYIVKLEKDISNDIKRNVSYNIFYVHKASLNSYSYLILSKKWWPSKTIRLTNSHNRKTKISEILCQICFDFVHKKVKACILY